jgi:hypothetical protein
MKRLVSKDGWQKSTRSGGQSGSACVEVKIVEDKQAA